MRIPLFCYSQPITNSHMEKSRMIYRSWPGIENSAISISHKCFSSFRVLELMLILRLLPSTVKPPMPCVEDQEVNSLPHFPTFNRVKFKNSPSFCCYNINQKRIPREHDLHIVCLQVVEQYCKYWSYSKTFNNLIHNILVSISYVTKYCSCKSA